MSAKRPSIPLIAAMVTVSLAVLLMMVSIFPDWSSFDRTRRIGPVDYRLQADFDAVGFDYTMETTGSSGSSDPLGGIGGGIGGNFSRSDRKMYPEVRGEFLDNLGIIYNSYRTKTYQYELKMRTPPQDSGVTWSGVGNPAATLNISLGTDLIPWWPEAGERTITVRIELVEVDLWDEVSEAEREAFIVHINRVQVWAKTGYDRETDEYLGEDRVLGERSPLLTFDRIGDERSLEFSVGYPEGTDAAGLYVTVVGNMTDLWGRAELSPLSGKANTINIYPLATGKLVSGVGIPLALPLMFISSVLGCAALVMAIIRRRMYLSLILPAASLSVLAPIWFMLGMNAAVDLLSERLLGAHEGLSYQPGLFISFAGAAVMLLSLGIAIYLVVREKMAAKDEGGGPMLETPPVFRRIDDEKTEGNNAPASTFRRIDPPR
ncbi:MAG: hypothetical protein JW939_05750 [Candidatus Thermoplasmatota archaeon]|nr:hypothetical protein [Candidatus Thermoplasmatota archaeon]